LTSILAAVLAWAVLDDPIVGTGAAKGSAGRADFGFYRTIKDKTAGSGFAFSNRASDSTGYTIGNVFVICVYRGLKSTGPDIQTTYGYAPTPG